MLVGVMSDTHDNIAFTRYAARVLLEKGVELVIHAGDIIAPFVLRVLWREGVKKLIAVYGNNCGEKLGLQRVARQLGYEIYEPPLTLELAGKKILVLHGVGSPETTVTLAEALAASNRYDVVIYGHTHRPDVRKIGRTLLLNPGEVCAYLTGSSTVAVLDLEKLEASIIEVASAPDDARV